MPLEAMLPHGEWRLIPPLRLIPHTDLYPLEIDTTLETDAAWRLIPLGDWNHFEIETGKIKKTNNFMKRDRLMKKPEVVNLVALSPVEIFKVG